MFTNGGQAGVHRATGVDEKGRVQIRHNRSEQVHLSCHRFTCARTVACVRFHCDVGEGLEASKHIAMERLVVRLSTLCGGDVHGEGEGEGDGGVCRRHL